MESVGNNYQYLPFFQWAELLHIEVDDFDIEKIKEMPLKFNNILSELERNIK